MKQYSRQDRRTVSAIAVLALTLITTPSAQGFERTEQREPCSDYSETKRPMFGDLHVHTDLSFDSYVSSQRNDPDAAYRYAKGEPIMLPDENGEQTIVAKYSDPWISPHSPITLSF